MGITPCRITATGFETGHIDCVFNSKAQSIQWTPAGRRQIESRYKGVTLSNGDRGAIHSLALTEREQSATPLQAMMTSKPSEEKGNGWEAVTPSSTYFPPSTLSSQR
jgi:hypothetical protein